MSDKHLLREPHVISNDAWWYETCKGIEIYHGHTWLSQPAGSLNISWAELRAALKRKDKKGKTK